MVLPGRSRRDGLSGQDLLAPLQLPSSILHPSKSPRFLHRDQLSWRRAGVIFRGGAALPREWPYACVGPPVPTAPQKKPQDLMHVRQVGIKS